MEPVLEGGDNAEVPATASEPQEKVGVFTLADTKELSIGQHNVGSDKIVAGKAMPAHEPADAATEGKPRDPRMRDDSTGRSEAESLCLAVELAPKQPRPGAYGLGPGIDLDALHRSQIDDNAVVADGATGNIVSTTANRDWQFPFARQVDAGDDVGRSSAAHDQGWMAVDRAV